MENKQRLGWGVTAALLAIVAVGLAGCSGKTASASAAEAVRQASERGSAHDSVSFEMTGTVDGVPGLALDVSSTGVYDLKAGQMQAEVRFMGQEAEAILDGRTAYLKTPVLGDQWVKQDLEDGSPAGMGLFAEDPTKVLDWLSAAGDDVTAAGSDDIPGQSAKHYRVELNLRDAAARLDGEKREQLEQALELLGSDTLPIDLWINGDGLPVRIRYEMSFGNSQLKQLKDATTTFSIDLFDWGKPVSVKIPDPADVQDATGFLGSLLRD